MSNVIRGWFEGLYFLQPVYFAFGYPLLIVFIGIILFLWLKLFFRPKKSEHSRYLLIGNDAVWLAVFTIACLSVIALAGPRIGDGYTLNRGGSVDVAFLVDTSFSLVADDLRPTRQEVIKSLLLDLVAKDIFIGNDRTVLFTFGSNSNWRMPLSEDLRLFSAMVADINHPTIYEEEFQTSTDFSAVLEHIPKCFDRQDGFVNERRREFNLKQYNNNRIAILLSDGNDEGGGDLLSSTRELRRRGIKVYTIGVGTEIGKRIVVKARNINDSSKVDTINIKTTLKMKDLEAIANATGGEAFILNSEEKIPSLKAFIKDVINKNRSSLPRLAYSDGGRDVWWEVLAIPSVLLALLIIMRAHQ
ncbi:MAG: vWA domain-containing protein [Patescibacteria group bacterium]